jgi:hypothetical protein
MNTFSLVRGIHDHPIIGVRKPFSQFEAWTWLLSEAAWKDRRYLAGSILVDLKRGQVAHSTRFMARTWGWPETKVRRFLSRLKTGAMIGAETGAGITIITVCNYDAYQFGGQESGAAIGARNGAKVAQQRRRKETSKQGSKESIGEKNPKGWPLDAFPQWYAAYPKHVDRKDAERTFNRCRAAGEISFDALMAATMRYVVAVAGKEKRFIKYPAVWLNKGGYLDEPESAATNGAGSHMPSARDPKTFTADDWQCRLELYRQDGWWAAHWGPEPGQVDCLVPAALFDTMVQRAKPLNGGMR